MAKRTDVGDKPYVDNYPPLKAWLEKIAARCDWQIPLGPKNDPSAYVECWRASTGREFIVVVLARRSGWNIFTDCADGKIVTTLADAEKRLGFNFPQED